METNQKNQNDQNNESPEKVNDSGISRREELLQQLRDKGIEVIDDTKEWEGKTTIIFPMRRPPQDSNEKKI